MDKLYAIQDVFISVQSALDDVASYGERIKKYVSYRGAAFCKKTTTKKTFLSAHMWFCLVFFSLKVQCIEFGLIYDFYFGKSLIYYP